MQLPTEFEDMWKDWARIQDIFHAFYMKKITKNISLIRIMISLWSSLIGPSTQWWELSQRQLSLQDRLYAKSNIHIMKTWAHMEKINSGKCMQKMFLTLLISLYILIRWNKKKSKSFYIQNISNIFQWIKCAAIRNKGIHIHSNK